MSLDNLVGKTLETIEPDASVITRLLSSAERNFSFQKRCDIISRQFLLELSSSIPKIIKK